MHSKFTNKLETYIGLSLLLIAVLGFIFSVLTSLPKKEQVDEVARPLQEIPRDLFSSENPLNKAVGALSTPSGVPVTVDPGNLGKSNVFSN